MTVGDKFALPLALLTLLFTLYTLRKVYHHSTSLVGSFKAVCIFNISLQAVSIIAICLIYYAGNQVPSRDDLDAMPIRCYYLMMSMNRVLFFLMSLCNCRMLELVKAFNPRMKDYMITRMLIMNVILFLLCISYRNLADLEILFQGQNEIFVSTPAFTDWPLILYGSIVFIFDYVQSVYLAINFHRLSKKQEQEKTRPLKNVISIIILGLFVDVLSFVFDIIATKLHPDNSDIFLACNLAIAAVTGFRVMLLVHVYLNLKDILFTTEPPKKKRLSGKNTEPIVIASTPLSNLDPALLFDAI